MNISVRYHESRKGGDGTLHTYDVTIEKDIPEEGLQKEQIVEKAKATHRFLHNLIHTGIEEQMIKDGLKFENRHLPGPQG